MNYIYNCINHMFIKSGVFLQRNETLLVEYKKLGRGNKIVDHRIGENDPTMSLDEKMVKRFALERPVSYTHLTLPTKRIV